jgi:hypothetical protein
MSVNVLTSEQTKASTATSDKFINVLNYWQTHPEAKLGYHVSGMILNIHSDTSHLSEREAKSRLGEFFYMGIIIDNAKILTNGENLMMHMIIKHVMSSSAKAEIGSVFLNAKASTVPKMRVWETGLKMWPSSPHRLSSLICQGFVSWLYDETSLTLSFLLLLSPSFCILRVPC